MKCPSGPSVIPPFFFFNDTATTEIYTLSLHDALPISSPRPADRTTRSIPRAPHRCRDKRSRPSCRSSYAPLAGDDLARSTADDGAVDLRIRGTFGAEHEDATVGAQIEPRTRIG